jgi:hypothetical protein
MDYTSFHTVPSERRPGVVFTILKMSFERRVELAKRIRLLAQKLEFFEAGNEAKDKIEAAILATEVERVYLQWGLVKVDGLELDGKPATAESLLEAGPEDLCREALDAIKAECGLNEQERKN